MKIVYLISRKKKKGQISNDERNVKQGQSTLCPGFPDMRNSVS
jgi:hypothetical protein